MKIDDDLIIQWEPKIQRMLSNVFVVGMDRDDIAQELRIAILKSAKSFDESRGVSFHTYLHTTMINTIRTLITKAQKQPEIKSLDTSMSNGAYGFYNGMVSYEILEALRDPTDYEGIVEVDDLIFESGNLTDKEQKFLQLRLEGLTMEEISEDLNESAYKVRQSLREKFSGLADEYEINH
tara:strand:+ start:5910 stop:6449 length:540 start_codon:yes stop_codon:yes gene_type:complete